jgi:hypothetical protein
MKYRKKPVVIEAVQWTGPNLNELRNWITGSNLPTGVNSAYGDFLHIETLEGCMEASLGDYIIKGIKGEFYPCKPDIFAATYELVGA